MPVAFCLGTGAFAQLAIDRYLTDPLTYTTVVSASNQVSNPRDLDFKPNTHELWVMMRGGSNGGDMVIVNNAGLPGQSSIYKKDSHSGHFMVQASAMAFSENGEWAAVSEIQNTASPTSTFMGPALWTGDRDIFATVFQNNWVSGKPLGSHLSMLHQSPFAMGIAADSAKVYWVMDGHFGTICRYDFVLDHSPGYDYHGTGKIWRYVDVPVSRVPNIPSHMVLDRANGWLYFIDGGAKQVKRMNVNSGSETGNLTVPPTSNEPLASYKKVEGATVEVIATWATQPSGIDFSEGRLVVSDHTTGEIRIYDVSGTPAQIGTINTGMTGIMGVKVGPDGRIWYVHNTGNKVVRIDPLPLADDAAIVGITSPVVKTSKPHFYSINDPVCSGSVTPVVTLANMGANVLTDVQISYQVDGSGPVTTYSWSGSLATGASTSVTLPVASFPSGTHHFVVWTSQPNGVADMNERNDLTEGMFRSIDPVLSIPFSEGFDAATFPPSGWSYVHFNTTCFMSRNAAVGGFGASSGCLKMDNYSGDMDIEGQIDHLIMPRFDLSSAPFGTSLDFNVAYRQYNSASVDRLMVKASTDCGDTWTTLYDKQGSNLSTGTPTTGAFTPTAAQWRAEQVDLTTVLGQSDVLFMFQTVSDYGNNVFIDDILIGNSVGMADAAVSSFSLFPNPNTGAFSIRGSTDVQGRMNVQVVSVDGRLVQERIWNAAQGGTFDMDLGSVALGSYTVVITDEAGAMFRMPVLVH
ncbi:MAG: hypothetical protein JNM31_15205 [Flavobacteriales bacterium]|nr:hypothetical protein [Flavobacteriales bacterium]